MNIDRLKKEIKSKLEVAISNSNTSFLDYKLRIYANTFGNFYRDISVLNKQEDIVKYMYQLIEDTKIYKTGYDELHEKLKVVEDTIEKNKIVNELNTLSYKLKAYYDVVMIIKRHLNLNSSIVNNNESELVSESKRIINLISKYNALNYKSNEAIKTNERIYSIKDNRRNRVAKILGIEGLELLFEIESLESRISLINYKKEDDFVVNSSDYIKLLKSLLSKMNSYLYNDPIDSKESYEAYLYKLYDLIESLFGKRDIIIPKSNISLSTLISYLGIFNFKGGYDAFKSKNPSLLIGGEKITNKKYQEGLNYISSVINNLCDYANKTIGNKKVTIVSHDYKEELYQELVNKLLKLENKLYKKEDGLNVSR